MTDSFAVVERAPNAHASIGCGGYASGNSYITGAAINSHSTPGCPFTLAVTPHASVRLQDFTDLVFEVWSNKGPQLSFDNATVGFAVGTGATTYFTKTTADYSILAYHSTFVVYLEPDDFAGISTIPVLDYTVTITTEDSLVYSMLGVLYMQAVPPLVPPAILTGTMPSNADIMEVD
jgi:hypothetical protein